jgi:O-antigen/teichoic acid export membrane protein
MATVLAAQMVTLALNFAVGVLAARIFTPELRGEWGMFVTAVSFVTVFTTLGLPEALVYFHRQGQADRGRAVTSVALGAMLSALIAVLAATLLVQPLAAGYFPTGGVALVWASFAAGAALVVLRNSTAFLQARHRFLAAGLCNLVLPAGVTTALVAVWYFDLALLDAGRLYVVATLVAAVVAFAPLVRWLDPRSLDVAYVKGLLRFSLKSYSQAIANQLNYRLDMFVVAYLVGSLAEVAYYHVAAGVAALLWVVPDSYGQVIYPRLAAYSNERDRTAETVMALRVVFAVVACAAVCVGLVAPWFIPLVFGDAYETSADLLLLLLPGVVAISLSKILTRYFVSRNRHQLNTYCIAVAIGVDVSTNAVLLPRLGIYGAPISASIAYVVMAAALSFVFIRTGDLRREDWAGFPGREIRLGVEMLRSRMRGLHG